MEAGSDDLRRAKWWPRWPAVALAAALLAALALGGSSYSTPENVHTAVYQWAQGHPGQPVPVIVQASGHDGGLVEAVEAAGGAVQRQFGIIPAVDADVPTGSLAALAGQDAVGYISLDAPMVSTGFVDTTNLASAYPFAVNAPSVWNASTPRTGQGVGVAVIDSGISSAGNPDFQDSAGGSRVVAETSVNSTTTNVNDGYGHGTHVAGIAAGDGDLLARKYIGIAPGASLIDIKIADDSGAATLANAIAGIQWAVDNKDLYNIRVMNLSVHSSVTESYRTSPLDAAVEFAWLRGIVVVVSSGNDGTAADSVSYPPSNDPFVITVGATDDMGTPTRDDDVVAFFSSRGLTQDGFQKPEVLAPGRRIASVAVPGSVLAKTYPDRFVDQFYFRLSGTSMSAPVVAGIAALMLEQNPALTPGQVKYILANTAQQLPSDSSAKHVLADSAVFFSGIPADADATLSPGRQVRMSFTAKVGAIVYVLGQPDPAAAALEAGFEFDKIGPPGTNLDNVVWESIKWNAIKWDAIKWGIVKWDAIKWDIIKWDVIKWDSVKWSAVKWGAVKWDAVKWDVIKWDSIKWSSVKWDAVTSTDATLTGLGFSSSNFDSSQFSSAEFDTYLPDPALNGCERGRADCSRLPDQDHAVGLHAQN